MNIRQAKELDLVSFLERLGFQPTSVRGHDVWFRSPFRPEERTPSFKVDAVKRVWFDFGAGVGGTIIDFVEQYENAPDISAVLKSIERVVGGVGQLQPTQTSTRAKEERAKARPVIEEVRPIDSPLLEGYLVSRGIPLELARLYLEQIRYGVEDRAFEALAFRNDAGGFEVRSPSWKGSVGTKDITTLAVEGREDFAVFEGAFDFLSTMVFYKADRPKSNVLVLNSVSLIERAVQQLQGRGARRVFAYLDHDQAGDDALARLVEVEALRVQDASSFYAGFKDANALLMSAKERGRSD